MKKLLLLATLIVVLLSSSLFAREPKFNIHKQRPLQGKSQH